VPKDCTAYHLCLIQENRVAFCYFKSVSQPVKLPDALVIDARLTGELTERSIAAQVEFWARLGRSIEPLLQGDRVLSLCRSASIAPLSECLNSVDTTRGRKRMQAYLASGPFPHYEAHPEQAGLLIRIDEDHRRTTGRFANRKFRAVKANANVAAQ
jgi:hypothetical protein